MKTDKEKPTPCDLCMNDKAEYKHHICVERSNVSKYSVATMMLHFEIDVCESCSVVLDNFKQARKLIQHGALREVKEAFDNDD